MVPTLGLLTVFFWTHNTEWKTRNHKLVRPLEITIKSELGKACVFWGVVGESISILGQLLMQVLSQNPILAWVMVGFTCLGPFPLKLLNVKYEDIKNSLQWGLYALFVVTGGVMGTYLWYVHSYPQETIFGGIIEGIIMGVLLQRSLEKPIEPRQRLEIFKEIGEGKGIRLSVIKQQVNCTSLDIPRTIKGKLWKKLKQKSLVLRGGVLITVQIPPSLDEGTPAECQLCKKTLSKSHYWQCVQCGRFTCDEDYQERQQVGFTKCSECGGELVKFPFTCHGCELDFIDRRDLHSTNRATCPLCGYQLDPLKHVVPLPQLRTQSLGQSIPDNPANKSLMGKGQEASPLSEKPSSTN